MTKYWNESYETLPRKRLDALKLKRLKDTVQRVYERVPFTGRSSRKWDSTETRLKVSTT